MRFIFKIWILCQVVNKRDLGEVMVKSEEIVREFLNLGVHLTNDALERMSDFSHEEIEKVLSELEGRENRPSIITDDVFSRFLSSDETLSSEDSIDVDGCENRTLGGESLESSPQRDDKYNGILEEDSIVARGGEGFEGKVEVLRNVTGESSSEGTVDDFVELFNDRYDQLSSIVRAREGFQSYTQMENIVRHEGDQVNLVGLVNEKRRTRKNDAWIVVIEDPTGKAVIYVKDSQRNEKVIEDVERVVTDELIGVKAKVPDNLKSGKRNPLVWGNEIFFPDIPISKARQSSTENQSREEASGYAVLISDLHVGSSEFLPGAFNKFIKWINGSAGNSKQREMAEQVKYLLIAGDLVDGIGIYPGQQKELDIESIREQYEKVAELLSRVPDDIVIIASPGNHDAVRLAEPQPALYTEVASPLREINVKLVGNPALLSIEGVKFLMYHGMGFDDLISADPGLDREDAAQPMKEVMRRRHLAPIYGEPMGGRTPIAPEQKDYLVIDEIPDVLHCGHLHKYGCAEYRGVLMVNSATFQAQTSFMKRQGVDPTPGHVPLVDLETREARAINFA